MISICARFLLIVGAVLGPLTSLNASNVNGIILDESSGNPLAYVNVGVVGKNVGTVSDFEGRFQLEVAEQYDQDTLKISMVGYKSRSFTVADFKAALRANSEVTLTESVVTMKEVVVRDKRYRGRKLRERLIGNTKAATTNHSYFAFNALGNEMGIRIKVRRNPTFVQEFNLFITKNQYDTFKFRLNFYSVRNSLPDQNLLNENIIVSFAGERGVVRVDLRQYNIVLEDDVIVTMEWIEELGKHGLAFATDSGTSAPTITRQTSQGDWKETGRSAFGAGIGITLKVLQ